VFIHSELDDAALLPSEFRVLCHIARRGECFASLETIAKNCRVSKETARAALKSLIAQSFIIAERREGETTLRRVAPRLSWNPYRKLPPLQEDGSGGKFNPTPSKTRQAHPSQNVVGKGNPIEVNPDKGGLPPGLEKFSDWQLRKDYRESDNPAERKAIKEEQERRKAIHSTPAAPKPKPPQAAGPASQLKPFEPSPELAAKFRAGVKAAVNGTTPPHNP